MAKKDINEELLQALDEVAEELQFISEMQVDTEIDHYRADIALSDFFGRIAKTVHDDKITLAATRVKELFDDLPKWYA